MLALNDPRWKKLKGSYRGLYDASEPLRRLFNEGARRSIWEELWDELHHQGDVDSASYAAVPHLLEFSRSSRRLDWNAFGLIAVIELERPSNPDVPSFLAKAYSRAIEDLPVVIGSHPQKEWDESLAQYAMACIAVSKGQRVLATAYLEMSLSHAKSWLHNEFGFSWQALKRRQFKSLTGTKSKALRRNKD